MVEHVSSPAVEAQAASAVELANPTGTPLWSTALIMNPVVLDPKILPFQLADGACVDRATEQERDRFRELLKEVVAGLGYDPLQCFESHIETEAENGGTRWHFKELPQEEWRYYVVRTNDNGAMNIDLGIVSGITRACLEFQSLTIRDHGFGYRTPSLTNHFHMGPPGPTKQVTQEDLAELASMYALKIEVAGGTGQLRGPFPEIGRALQMLDNVALLTPSSEFHILGLFAIIEMLITHNPKLEDRGDSITHQMKGKIPLLSRRFDRPLPYQEHFGQANSNTVWSALYGYRSTIAHGGIANFNAGQLQCLKSQENANAFLFLTVQSLIRHALHEPQLYRDIKEC